MRSVSECLRRAFIVSLLAVLCAASAVPSYAASSPPDSGTDCPNRVSPPPPVDPPEQNPPGPPHTSPLPVPPTPIGGPRMDACGLVLPAKAPPVPEGITAASWVIHNLETGEVLAAKAPHARHRPASLIKLLLALVVVQKFEPDDVITPTVEDISTACSCVGLVAGAEYRVDKMLHGMLMVSGNDAAHAFGTALGGQRAALRMMNELAERLGALDTRATTTSGLDARGMVTSAYDLSVIFNYAMEHERIADILATEKIMFPGGGEQPAYPIYNDNDLLGTYPGFLGGKTGFTDNARHTYVGGARRNGTAIAVVLLRGKQYPVRMSEQAARLLNYGFTLAEKGTEPVGTVLENRPRSTLSKPSAPASEEPTTVRATPRAAGAAEDPRGGRPGMIWVGVLVVVLLASGGYLLARRGRTKKQPPQ